MTTTTNPNPFIANSPGTLYYNNPNIIPVNNNNYQLQNIFGYSVSNTFTGNPSSKNKSDISGNWSSICSNSDGTNLAACINPGGIYTSTDNGSSWNLTDASNNLAWTSICSDSTGQYLAACAYNNGIYTSQNYGINWSLQYSYVVTWNSICSDSTGQYLAITVQSGNIFTSQNYGLSWTYMYTFYGPNINCYICSDSTGQYLCVSTGETMGIFTSQNYGAAWGQQSVLNVEYLKICSSSSGKYLAACCYLTNTGIICTSQNYGASWNQTLAPILQPTVYYSSICSSSSGQYLFACISNGGVCYSTDYGSNWYISAAPQESWTYICCNSTGNLVSSTVSNGNIYTHINIENRTFTFNNVILPAGRNILSIFNLSTNSTVAINIEVDISTICFKEGTKILCLIDKKKEEYVPIEKITENMFVKTYKNGYKKAKFIIKSSIMNSEKHTISKLYKLSKHNNSKLIDDLYVTGSHALLHDTLTYEEHESMNKLHESINYSTKIHDKYKLIAYYDDKFEEVNDIFEANIYHIILESEDKSVNYGIYANGILAESTDYLTLSRADGFQKINNICYKVIEKPVYDINLKIESYLKNKNKGDKSKMDKLNKLEKIEKIKTWKNVLKINHSKTYKKL